MFDPSSAAELSSRGSIRVLRHPTDPLLSRLSAFAALSAAEATAVRALAAQRQPHVAGGEIQSRPGAPPRVLLSGWACRSRALSDGRRQIVSLFLPGDVIGLSVRPQPPEVPACTALTRAESAEVAVLDEALRTGVHKGLAAACLAVARVEEGRALDHLMRLGRQTALERTAHLLLELRDRLKEAGLGDGPRFPMPLTQEVLADVLGLSIVHVNRTIQHLRREKLVEIRSGWAELLQPGLLAEIADYQAAETLADGDAVNGRFSDRRVAAGAENQIS